MSDITPPIAAASNTVDEQTWEYPILNVTITAKTKEDADAQALAVWASRQ